ncbi:thiamine phosphate synthase [soil metagenome]
MNESQLKQALRVYLVADPEQCFGDFLPQVEDGLRGGVTMVQLRAKNFTDRGLYAMALSVQELCRRYEAAFLMNDRIDIALAVGADGVHLGVDDLPIEAARLLVPDSFVIGFSPDTNDLAARAKARGVNYLGVGPINETTTKRDAGPKIGVELLAKRVQLSGLPVIGIGGITTDDVPSVIEAGACGVAVVSAILKAGDARMAASRLRTAVDGALSSTHA